MSEIQGIIEKLIEFIESKQGENLHIIDVTEITPIANYIIIITANSSTHANSLSNHIVDFIYENKLGHLLMNKHVNTSNPWILIDCSDFIINIFEPETREYYKLENLYVKGKNVYKA